MLYIRKFMWWSFTTPIVRKIVINDFTNEIQCGYRMKGLLSTRWYFRPLYYKYFDSFERKSLAPLQPRHNKKYGE